MLQIEVQDQTRFLFVSAVVNLQFTVGSTVDSKSEVNFLVFLP